MMTGMKTYENHREWLESLEPGNNLNKTAKKAGHGLLHAEPVPNPQR